MQTESNLDLLWGELKDNMFPGMEDFLTKYFEGQSWFSTVQNVLNQPDLANIVTELLKDFFNLSDSDDLTRWLSTFQSLLFDAHRSNIHLRSCSLSTLDTSFSASIYFETSDVPAIAGNTRVYGEYHRTTKPALTNDAIDHDGFLQFSARALQVYNTQPTRHFLHTFLVRGTAMELWIFDRSGAYGSKKLDLTQNPRILLFILAGYGMMSDQESGVNTFIQCIGPASSNHVAFGQDSKFYIRSELIPNPDYLIGPGTTCFTASACTNTEPDIVIKFSWRDDTAHTELQSLKRARERNVWGVVQVLDHKELVSVADIRSGLSFPRQYINRTLSCIATHPLGRPIRKYISIRELLEALGDLVKALESLYVNGKMLHRDVAIKNLVIDKHAHNGSSRGIVIDFDQALDLDTARAVEPLIGSDGFMAIGILSGKAHTYRHDLESLFYVFLWLAIGNDTEHDHADEILNGLPKTSRFWKWCSMDFQAVGVAKAVDMSPEGFEVIMNEFVTEFTPLRDLAKELHGLIFPLRNGAIFTGTDMDQISVQQLYSGMADAFHKRAVLLPR